jgi:hypothetical protein
VIVSAAEGYEFTDLGGRHPAGGGSHGSLLTGDSEVPMLAVGIDLPSTVRGQPSITDLAGLVTAHFESHILSRESAPVAAERS